MFPEASAYRAAAGKIAIIGKAESQITKADDKTNLGVLTNEAWCKYLAQAFRTEYPCIVSSNSVSACYNAYMHGW